MNKHTAVDLKQMQSLPLDIKIEMTKRRIKEWYEAFDGNVYVSFSGGKDSTVLLDLARRIYPDIPAVFVDTGLEYPEIREFVKSIDNVTWLKPEMNFRKVIETYGYPVGSKRTASNIEYGRKAKERGDIEMWEHYICGKRVNKRTGEIYTYMPMPQFLEKLYKSNIKVSSRCCYVMKEQPLNDYAKETGQKAIMGITAAESKRREQAWLRTGCNNFGGSAPKSKPLSFWTEQDVLEYISIYKLPYAKVYGEIKRNADGKWYTTGAARTGCMFCMFGVQCEKEPNRFQRMRITHPKIYDYCMKPMVDGGLGIAEVLDFIGVKH